MGPGTFTGRLWALAEQVQAGEAPLPVINVDGPYGMPPDMSRYSSMLLVAGGIGITPMLSLFRHVHHEVKSGRMPFEGADFRLRLVWLSRDVDALALAVDALVDAATDDRFSVHLCVTSGGPAGALGGGASSSPAVAGGVAAAIAEAVGEEADPELEELLEASVTEGRANLRHELDETAPAGSSTLLFACGPLGLVQRCSKIALEAGVEFKAEAFSL
mmetsp:Transcript_27677/g.72698  ORF Transcript_27677/g.72698 Transcript_27677/m.72698 type:complete len:217 (-) Transcript_27677:127-777(-)